MNWDLIQKITSVSYDNDGVIKYALSELQNGRIELYHNQGNPPYNHMRYVCNLEKEYLPIIIELINNPVKSIDNQLLQKL